MKAYAVLSRRLNLDALLIINSIVITFVFLWKVSWGFTAPGILDGLYDIQARSLSQGHAYLVPGPPQVYYHDSSMFHGHAYLYFGPFPAIVLLICSAFFGRFLAHYMIATLFVFCFMYSLQLLIAESVNAALDAEDGRSSRWRLSSVVLLWCFLFAPPLPTTSFSFCCPNFYIYQQQILFGLGLGMAGVLALTRGMPFQKTGGLAVAGLAFAVAASVRATWLPVACAIVTASVILLVVKLMRYGRKAIANWEVTSLVAGVSLLLFLFLWNHIRFGSPTDFGVFFRQNCADDNMFRLSTGFFSWKAKLDTFLLNLLAYYTNPSIQDATGLSQAGFSVHSFPSTGFFYAHPQWLLVLALIPLGLYRVCTTKRALLPFFSIFLVAAVYLNVVVAGVPPATSPRYFTEFYLFVILALFSGLLAVLPPRAGIISMVVLLLLHFLPGGLAGICSHPNLRLLDSGPAAPLGFNASFNRDPGLDIFIVDGAIWPKDRITVEDSSTLKPYNAMGIYPWGSGEFKALDVAAVYIIPGKPTGQQGTTHDARDGVLQLHDVRASSVRGSVKVYVEGLLIGSLPIYPDRNVNGTFNVPLSMKDNLPYQIMMVFLPKGHNHLPAHPPPVPPWQLGGLSLRHNGDRMGDTARMP